MRYKSEKGFTLVELIIVIAILAVLASIAVPNLLGSVEKARIAKDEANAKLIGDAFVMALAQDEIPISTNTYNQIRDGRTYMNIISKNIDPLPLPVSKKYKGPGDWGYFWFRIQDGKVTIYVQDYSTITQLYPSVEDPVDK